ncbi:protein-tyrosine phosphatase [Breznakia blatticola]|uniref:protein-tyrosine-phosphatase n=1 Tax=Breznakia blatticola TaxID=1754012 RepID=A0A4R7ZVE1_9FIRM|nr:low molecular weight protein-tyrosine-phosphatase [Breznakia blatticola]TDW20808.1 protein-tyrosine phosphatase [Breznakia blatticola]
MDKKRICFVCHGNICRSPMAEYVFKDMVKKANLEGYTIVSRATSNEEIGNDMHPGTKRILNAKDIPYTRHQATRLIASDAQAYDYFICMDDANVNNTKRMLNLKDDRVFKLLDLTSLKRGIADPWYTGDYETTYVDVVIGCEALLQKLMKNKSNEL